MSILSLKDLTELSKFNNRQFMKRISESSNEELNIIKVKKGQVLSEIIKVGYIYYIKKGVVVRYFYDIRGNYNALDLLNSREILGIATLNGTVPFQAEPKALTDLELVVVPERIIKDNFSESYTMLALNFQYYLSVMYLNWQVALAPGNERINHALIALAYYVGQEKKEIYCLPSYVTHEVLSEFASVSRSYVTRQLSKLIKQEIIQVENKNIYIKKLELLIALTPHYYPY